MTDKDFERNERYFAKTGYGCGSVMSDPKHVEALRSLTKEQIEALLHLFFMSDIYEVDSGELILGRWKLTREVMENDKEAETMAQLAASLVYLSGHLAEDFPFLTNNEETTPMEGRMELDTQKYLKSGKTIENLCEEFSIKANYYEDMVILNYSQTDSPKTHPIVMECRGLVLDKNTFELLMRSFERFFNYSEVKQSTDSFDFSKAFALEKIDGSLLQLFFHPSKNKWFMTTRGTIEGTGNVGFFDMNFRQLFDMTVKQYGLFWKNLDPRYCYTFEMVSPENKVVKPYSYRALYLIGMRDKNDDFKEVSFNNIEVFADMLGVKTPQRYSFRDIDHLLKLAAGLKDLDEGFVCVDYSKTVNGNFPRIKVKSPAYVAIAHIKESGGRSVRALMQLIWNGEEAEFMAYFPEFSPVLSKIRTAYDAYVKEMGANVELAKTKKDLSRKEFAGWALSTSNSGLMFMVYDKKVASFQEYFRDMIKSKGEKIAAKFLINTLGLKNMKGLSYSLDPDVEIVQE